MKKTEPAPRASEAALPNPWADTPVVPESIKPADTAKARQIKHAILADDPQPENPVEYDMEGLMTDFPTAKELERFVYDQTGFVLNLKGRANKLKYQVAMDALNGKPVDPVFIGGDNPYIDKADMIPQEDIGPCPERDPSLPDPDTVQNTFVSRTMPHPNSDLRSQGRMVDCLFKKYRNGMISYEVLGTIDFQPHGEKIDKYGRLRPEIIRVIDPRTGEQVVVRKDGTLTPMGRNLRALMQRMRINNSNFWDAWVDRDFVAMGGGELQNPWDTEAQ